MPDYFGFKPAKGSDPGGAKTADVFAAHAEYERARSARQKCVCALAASSALVWLAAEWPSLIHGQVRTVVLAGWALILVVLVVACIAEQSSRRRLALRISEAGSDGGTSAD